MFVGNAKSDFGENKADRILIYGSYNSNSWFYRIFDVFIGSEKNQDS